MLVVTPSLLITNCSKTNKGKVDFEIEQYNSTGDQTVGQPQIVSTSSLQMSSFLKNMCKYNREEGV
jgi:hypothetical protein